MKLTDGLFHKVFDEIATDYPEIGKEHMIVDIGAARLADTPEMFDVIVMPNLYGDILSDVAAQITGSVGLGASANIGAQCAMFEAIHGSAPDIAGQNIANPSGLILAGVMMLVHIGQSEIAQRVHNAWLRTIEDGVHTGDIARLDATAKSVGTMEFADAVIARLREEPKLLKAATYDAAAPVPISPPKTRTPAVKQLVGIDIFAHSTEPVESLAQALRSAEKDGIELAMITNRGVKVWPQGLPETFCTDHWRCRFQATPDKQLEKSDLIQLLRDLDEAGIDFVKSEHLYTFDGELGFSLGQGQ